MWALAIVVWILPWLGCVFAARAILRSWLPAAPALLYVIGGFLLFLPYYGLTLLALRRLRR